MKRKNLLIGFFVLLFAVSLLPLIDNQSLNRLESLPDSTQNEQTVLASGESWLSGWQYRERLTLGWRSGAGAGYPMHITINYAGADDTGPVVSYISVESNSQTDFDDIRFTEADGITLRKYWRESKTDSSTSEWWILIDESIEISSTYVYVYYGNDAASYIGDGDDLFYFFDDFESGDMSDWTTVGAYWTSQSSVKKEGSYAAWGNSGTDGASRSLLIDFTDITNSFMVHQWVRVQTVAGQKYFSYGSDGSGGAYSFFVYNNDWAGDNGPVIYYEYNTVVANTWFRTELAFDFENDLYKFWLNGVQKTSHDLEDSVGNPIDDTMLYQKLYTQNGVSADSWVDDYYIRKWIAYEPTFTVVGAEEDTAPINTVLPYCTNLDDGDNLYARYKIYEFTNTVTDAEGYAHIDYVDMYLLTTAPATYWRVRYNETADTWSEIDGGSYIELLTGSTVKSGITLTITWKLYIEWVHGSVTDYDMSVQSFDESGFTDNDQDYALNYDTDCQVVYSDRTVDDNLGTVDRGNVDGTFYFSGQAKYNTNWNRFPPDGALNWVVWTADTDISRSNDTAANGWFNVTVTADDLVGSDTFACKAIADGTLFSSTSYFVTDPTDNYISDRVKVISYSGSDSRIDIGTESDCSVLLRYEYDNLGVEDGTVTINGVASVYSGAGEWDFGDTKGTTQIVTYNSVAASGNEHGISSVNQNGQTYGQIWDRIDFTMTSNYDWTIIGNNVTLSATGVYEYDSASWSGTITWSDRYPSESTVNSYSYGTSQISSATDSNYGLTAFTVGTEVSVVFDDVAITGGDPNYYWVQYSPEAVWLVWGSPCSFEWDYNNSAVLDDMVIQARMNGTENARASTAGGSIYGLSIGSFDPSWYYVNITIYSEFTVGTRSFNLTTWTRILEVDILHSLQIVNFDITPTDYYFWITYQSNLLNATITIWDDVIDSGALFADNIYYSASEGMHQIQRSTIKGTHNLTFCITSTGTQYDKDFTVHDYVWWYNITYVVVDAPAYDCHLVILNSLFELIQFDTFEVYNNGTRIYHDIIQVVTGYAYNITIKNRFGDTVNSTTFSADYEMVLFVDTFSFKFMNWYNGFLRVNVTRAGNTYSEIIMPTEIIEFNLFQETYTFTVDFLNGTTKFSQEIEVNASTGYVITGDSLTDVLNLVNTVYTMTNAINVTVTTVNASVVTITLDLSNVNSTIFQQTINILTNIENSNSTIYDQTVSLLSQLTSVNSSIFSQTITILNQLTLIGSNVTANYLSLSSDLIAIDSSLYANFTELSATLVMMDSSLLSNFTSVSASLLAIDSSLLSNFTYVMANLTAIGSNITTNYLSVSAILSMIDSQLLSNFTAIVAQLTSVNSSIASQFITIIANVADLNTTMYLIDDPTHLNPLVLGRSLSDDYCDFTVVTNWHNATLSIYDNNIHRAGPTSELLSPIRYPLLSTSGTHNLSVFIDAGADSFWYNISYTVAEIIAYELNDWYVRPHLGIENWIECYFGTTWENSTVYVYDNGTLQTSVLEQDGGISFGFWMSGIAGLHQYEFNITSGSNVITVTWDFYLPDWGETALVVRWDLWTFQDNYTILELESNWRNCTYSIYLNTSLITTAAIDPTTLNITRPNNIGTYNLTLYADGGSQTYTISNIRYIVTAEGVTYDYSSYGGVVMLGNTTTIIITNVTSVAPPPPGLYMSTDSLIIGAIGVVGGFASVIVVARTQILKEREKSARESQK